MKQQTVNPKNECNLWGRKAVTSNMLKNKHDDYRSWCGGRVGYTLRLSMMFLVQGLVDPYLGNTILFMVLLVIREVNFWQNPLGVLMQRFVGLFVRVGVFVINPCSS